MQIDLMKQLKFGNNALALMVLMSIQLKLGNSVERVNYTCSISFTIKMLSIKESAD